MKTIRRILIAIAALIAVATASLILTPPTALAQTVAEQLDARIDALVETHNEQDDALVLAAQGFERVMKQLEAAAAFDEYTSDVLIQTRKRVDELEAEVAKQRAQIAMLELRLTALLSAQSASEAN